MLQSFVTYLLYSILCNTIPSSISKTIINFPTDFAENDPATWSKNNHFKCCKVLNVANKILSTEGRKSINTSGS